MESASKVPIAPSHLLAVGVPATSLAGTARAFAIGDGEQPICIDITAWTEAELDAFVCGPADALILWSSQATEEWISRIKTFRAHHPSLPVLVRIPGNNPALGETFLREGFQETYVLASQLPATLRRARARLAANRVAAHFPTAGAVKGEETPYRFDGLFQNLYDWIYVVGISEQGR